MDTKRKEEIALKAFRNNFNCAQAVVMAYTGDRDNHLLSGASAFGGGMGRLQKTCGAVTGSFMVLGATLGGSEAGTPESKARIATVIQEFHARFLNQFGSSDCIDLLGFNINTTEGKEKVSELKLSEKVCEKCVAGSIAIIDDMVSVYKR